MAGPQLTGCASTSRGKGSRGGYSTLSTLEPDVPARRGDCQADLDAGLRVGEIVQLRLGDVRIDERKGSVVVREGKGSKRREVPLNAKARKALQEYLRSRPDADSVYFFIGQRKEEIQNKTVQRAVSRFAEKAACWGL